MSLSDAAELATIATAAAIIVAIFALVGDRQQRHREFESMYVQRYWALNDSLSARAQLNHGARFSRRDKTVALRYLQLREDELEVRSLGFVTHKTWKVWSAAIAATRSDSRLLILRKSQPDDELVLLRQFLREVRDPYKQSDGGWFFRWLWSKVNGL